MAFIAAQHLLRRLCAAPLFYFLRETRQPILGTLLMLTLQFAVIPLTQSLKRSASMSVSKSINCPTCMFAANSPLGVRGLPNVVVFMSLRPSLDGQSSEGHSSFVDMKSVCVSKNPSTIMMLP